jgi:hypothetical protein
VGAPRFKGTPITVGVRQILKLWLLTFPRKPHQHKEDQNDPPSAEAERGNSRHFQNLLAQNKESIHMLPLIRAIEPLPVPSNVRTVADATEALSE